MNKFIAKILFFVFLIAFAISNGIYQCNAKASLQKNNSVEDKALKISLSNSEGIYVGGAEVYLVISVSNDTIRPTYSPIESSSGQIFYTFFSFYKLNNKNVTVHISCPTYMPVKRSLIIKDEHVLLHLWRKGDLTVYYTKHDSFLIRPCPYQIGIFIKNTDTLIFKEQKLKTILEKYGYNTAYKEKFGKDSSKFLFRSKAILEPIGAASAENFKNTLRELEKIPWVTAGTIRKCESSWTDLAVFTNDIRITLNSPLDTSSIKTILNKYIKDYKLTSHSISENKTYLSIRLNDITIGYEIVDIGNRLITDDKIVAVDLVQFDNKGN